MSGGSVIVLLEKQNHDLTANGTTGHSAATWTQMRCTILPLGEQPTGETIELWGSKGSDYEFWCWLLLVIVIIIAALNMEKEH